MGCNSTRKNQLQHGMQLYQKKSVAAHVVTHNCKPEKLVATHVATI
jgi:hypothetical protein